MKWDARIIRPHKIATTISLIQQFIESEPRKMKKKEAKLVQNKIGRESLLFHGGNNGTEQEKKSSGRLLLEYPFFAGP